MEPITRHPICPNRRRDLDTADGNSFLSSKIGCAVFLVCLLAIIAFLCGCNCNKADKNARGVPQALRAEGPLPSYYVSSHMKPIFGKKSAVENEVIIVGERSKITSESNFKKVILNIASFFWTCFRILLSPFTKLLGLFTNGAAVSGKKVEVSMSQHKDELIKSLTSFLEETKNEDKSESESSIVHSVNSDLLPKIGSSDTQYSVMSAISVTRSLDLSTPHTISQPNERINLNPLNPQRQNISSKDVMKIKSALKHRSSNKDDTPSRTSQKAKGQISSKSSKKILDKNDPRYGHIGYHLKVRRVPTCGSCKRGSCNEC